jgi:predicted ATP-grasp superfamily ATP-dependent carboligase
MNGGTMNSKILVTDGLNKNTLAILRSIGKSNCINITSPLSKVLTLGFYSKYCNKVHVIKYNSNDIDSYANKLLDILIKDKYDLLIPVGLTSCLAVTKHKDKFEKLTNIIVPEWNSMQIASNKDRTMSFAKDLGIPIPQTTVLYSESDLDKIKKYPIVIKSSDESGGFVEYCNNEKELYEKYVQLKSISSTNIIAQEYIIGFGCGFYGVYHNGKMISHFLHKRVKEFPITGGASAVAESYYDERLYNYGKKLCDTLNWNGPIMVEFKYDSQNDDYKLIEINPKLWGSLDLTIEAGINVPDILVNLALYNKEPSSEYTYIKYRWLFPDEFKVLISDFSYKKLYEFFSKTKDTKTNFYWRDPLPFIFQMMRSFIDATLIIFNKNKKFPHGQVEIIDN